MTSILSKLSRFTSPCYCP